MKDRPTDGSLQSNRSAQLLLFHDARVSLLVARDPSGSRAAF